MDGNRSRPASALALPIICTLSPEALAARRSGALGAFVSRAARRDELPDGLRFEFAATRENLLDIVSVIDAERQCCRFLRFDLTVSSDGGPMSLSLTGPPGTREFVAALLDE